MAEDRFVEICQEFVTVINMHVGGYVDACAGFAGNCARVERQVAKILREQRSKPNRKDGTVVVFASFNDPDHPDAIHHRIVAAKDFIKQNAEAGSNAQMHAASAIIFIFAKWDEVIRPRLALAKSVTVNQISSDIMGDIRLLRHAILHNDGELSMSAHKRLVRLGELIPQGRINLSNDVMHKIFAEVKMGLAELVFGHLGLPFTNTGPEAIKEIAVQRVPRRHQFRNFR